MIVHNWTRVFHEDLVKERNGSVVERQPFNRAANRTDKAAQ